MTKPSPVTDPLQQLLRCIDEGDESGVTRCLDTGCDPNATIGDSGDTPLHRCVRRYSNDAVEDMPQRSALRLIIPLLFQAGADPLRLNAEGDSPDSLVRPLLLFHSWWRSQRSRHAVLSADPDLRLRDLEGNNALHLAAEDGRENDVAKLIRTQRDLLETKNDRGHTPAYRAIANGHLGCARRLIKADTPKKTLAMRTRNGGNLMHAAACSNSAAIINYVASVLPTYLPPSSADGEAKSVPVYREKNRMRQTPLHILVANNSAGDNAQAVRVFLKVARRLGSPDGRV